MDFKIISLGEKDAFKESALKYGRTTNEPIPLSFLFVSADNNK